MFCVGRGGGDVYVILLVLLSRMMQTILLPVMTARTMIVSEFLIIFTVKQIWIRVARITIMDRFTITVVLLFL